MHYVYLITNRVNGKVYIGMTNAGVRERWYVHVTTANNGEGHYLHRAIRKYGKASFAVETLGQFAHRNEASLAEQLFIKEYQSAQRNTGYNITLGGEGTVGFSKPGPIKNIAGQTFGRLTAICKVFTDKYRHAIWRCICTCGNEKELAASLLLDGHTKSCGCLRK